MFSGNGKISARQMSRLLLFDVFGVASLLLPTVAVRSAGTDAMAVVLIGSILAVFYICFFLFFGSKADKDYFAYMEEGVGTFFSKFFLVLYTIKILFSLVFLVSYFTDLLEHTLLVGTNDLLLIGAILLTGIYIGGKGVEERGRTAEFLTYVIFLPIVFFLIIGFKKVDFTNVLPVFTGTNPMILSGSYSVLLTYSAVELLLFLTPLCRKREAKQNKKSITKTTLILIVLLFTFSLLSIGILGQMEIAGELWSSVTVMQIVELPGGLVRRQDALFLSLWILTVLLLTGSLVYYLSKISARIVCVKKEKLLLLPVCLLVFCICGTGFRLDTIFSIYGDYMKYIGFPQSILMPPLVYCAHLLQKQHKHNIRLNENQKK